MTQVASLLKTHSHYNFYRDVWQTIKDMREGYSVLLRKKEKYIPQRIGEEPEVYQNRLAALSYTNILNENIHRLCSILTSSPITLEYSSQFWGWLTKHMDGQKLTHEQLIYDLYSTLLYYGKVCIAIDAPSEVAVARSRAEYDTNRLYPRAILFTPLEVINWGVDWYLTLQIDEQNQPLEDSIIVATWRLWNSANITTWSTQVEVNSDNVITKVKVNGKWYDPMDKKAQVEPRVVPHNLGRVPIVSYYLKDEQWVGNAILPKAKQHFNIESSWTWAGRYAGVIQRVFTPLAPTPNDNPNLLLDPPDYNQLISDNAHVLIGQGFQFVETTGSAIATLGEQLRAIKEDVKDTVNITFASAAKTTVEQSGASKKVDMLLLQNALTSYGYIITEIDEELLELIALWAGEEVPETNSNLSYSLQDVEVMLDRADRLLPHAENLAPVTLREFYKQLQHLLLPDAPDEVKEEIDAETPTFEDEGRSDSDETDPRELRDRLKDYYELSDEEVDEVLADL